MVIPPFHTPKWSFLVEKPMVVGYHYFRKPPYENRSMGQLRWWADGEFHGRGNIQKNLNPWMQDMGRFPYQPHSRYLWEIPPPPMFDVGNSFFFLHAVAAPHNRRKVREGDKYTVYMVNIWWLYMAICGIYRGGTIYNIYICCVKIYEYGV